MAHRVAAAFEEYRELFRFVYRLDRFLLSHAGVSRALLHVLAVKYGVHDLDDVVAYLNERRPPELFFCSRHNGGADPFDGPLWLRLPQFHGALADQGITQVVGHSSQATIRLKHNMLMIDVRRPLVIEWQES